MTIRKAYLVFSLLVIMSASLTLRAQGQRNYSTAQIVNINSTLAGSEGDLYMDTILSELYLGLQSGALYKVTSTDNQMFDVANFTAAGLNLSLERDGVPTITIPLISTTAGNSLIFNANGLYLSDSDNQNLSLGARVGTNQAINITGGTGVTIDVADNDNDPTNELQNLSLGARVGTNQPVNISLGTGVTIDVADNDNDPTNELQNLTGATLGAGGLLTIDIQNGTSASVSLAPLRDEDWLRVGGGYATAITDNIYTAGFVGINANTPGHPLHVEAESASSAGPWVMFAGGGNVQANIGLRLYDRGTDANNANIIDFAHNPGTSTAVTMGQIKSRTLTVNHTTGADMILEASSNNSGSLNTNQLVLKNTGFVGIGTNTPGAKLDVDNGSVRFSDYGVGTYLDTLVSVSSGVHHLAVTATGDVIETNTYKSSKVFYPPAVVIDVSSTGSGMTIDLYQEYINRMGSPALSSTANPIPTYARNELEYHVLDFDSTVFNITGLTAGGIVTYNVISVPPGNCTFLNVVFVVK